MKRNLAYDVGHFCWFMINRNKNIKLICGIYPSHNESKERKYNFLTFHICKKEIK